MELINIGITLTELTEGGYEPSVVAAVSGRSAIFLKGEGFDAKTLWKAGFPAKDLRGALFDAPLLKSVGCQAEDMRAGGFPLRELIRDAGYTARQLRIAGFSVADFMAVPCSVTEMKAAGFTATECTEGGLDQQVVEVIFRKRTPPVSPFSKPPRRSPARTRATLAGSCEEISVQTDPSGSSPRFLTPRQLPTPGRARPSFTPAGNPPELVEISTLRMNGLTCEQAKSGGLLPSQCHQAGFTFEEGRAAGFKRRMDDWMTMDLTNPYNKW